MCYDAIFKEVEGYLTRNNGDISWLPFRKRSEHIWRVFQWAKRLMDGDGFTEFQKNSVLIAALFHDIGYGGLLDGVRHAENSADIFGQYADKLNLEHGQMDYIQYMIRNHSKKELLKEDGTPLELVILMEADLLDETGALSVVWDCMMEGGQEEQNFTKTYRHIRSYSGKLLDANPMKTDRAREFWSKKQRLTREFLNQLAFDLALNESHVSTDKEEPDL